MVGKARGANHDSPEISLSSHSSQLSPMARSHKYALSLEWTGHVTAWRMSCNNQTSVMAILKAIRSTPYPLRDYLLRLVTLFIAPSTSQDAHGVHNGFALSNAHGASDIDGRYYVFSGWTSLQNDGTVEKASRWKKWFVKCPADWSMTSQCKRTCR